MPGTAVLPVDKESEAALLAELRAEVERLASQRGEGGGEGYEGEEEEEGNREPGDGPNDPTKKNGHANSVDVVAKALIDWRVEQVYPAAEGAAGVLEGGEGGREGEGAGQVIYVDVHGQVFASKAAAVEALLSRVVQEEEHRKMKARKRGEMRRKQEATPGRDGSMSLSAGPEPSPAKVPGVQSPSSPATSALPLSSTAKAVKGPASRPSLPPLPSMNPSVLETLGGTLPPLPAHSNTSSTSSITGEAGAYRPTPLEADAADGNKGEELRGGGGREDDEGEEGSRGERGMVDSTCLSPASLALARSKVYDEARTFLSCAVLKMPVQLGPVRILSFGERSRGGQ